MKDSSFQNADGLVRYMEYRLQQKRPFVTRENFAKLGYLAGRRILMGKEDIAKRGQFVSLHDHDYADLVPLARERIQRGEIPANWLDEFNKFMDSQTESQPTAQEV